MVMEYLPFVSVITAIRSVLKYEKKKHIFVELNNLKKDV
jgi:hypothetical protein